ncbi:YqiA/YcfP family alpha/beta fold hydrolase [Xanthomonas arboricola pv. juglandis]|uniref:YqiA/YcfP family alpha/beta fold hydrolase n=1 Tax=Xanthomonas arboricola TaxID=56448 RepID=UPI00063E7B44|nr:YqiA/YcfP family alpha/beta fold hydrolase [Xanthomonas arboricola]MDN0220658.1 YqiA/YcfP family alpha/beta fold hydrolase [Xanthomonas arboricola pv. juglandis]MDN0225190.1 YqiA/YcfP family alpha/beta fold hydrolase [Xanthomonas arboricola pv. juglandis]MDN0229403.1 YqiA/YcfP family alpha/beta fold hydrolase [Xanthomonas arboricola pv. juglandis]MDN0233566.1 YqiA/YcfP family alpha/beta fold hydrolase [Xanthomonas arboricola pv. juglandis]MDN0237827.1 YqiA/YcfP family alpha/beta fold hydrol
MSRGHCILSHGFESGPDALKVTALADVAGQLGWTHERPDYTDLDARREVSSLGDVQGRLQRLLEVARAAADKGPLVLVGSSLGSYIAAQVSLQVPTRGLFLMVPPTRMGPLPALDAARVPISIVHAWRDELIPAGEVIAWAQARHARLLLVDDEHRLASHVDASARAFAELLQSL